MNLKREKMSQRQRSFVEETRLNAKMIIARVFSTKRGARSLTEKVSSLVSRRRNAPCALFTLVCFMFHFFLNFLFFFSFSFFVLLLLISLESRSAREHVLRTDVQSR